MEHHARKVGLGETGDTALTVRGRPQGGGNVLQGGGPINTTVWFGDVGNFGRNGEEGIRVTHRFPKIDLGEASAVDRRRDVGNDGGEIVREEVGTQSARNYIGRRQATVAQWMAL